MKKLSSRCIDCIFKKFYIADKEEMSDLSKEKMEIVKPEDCKDKYRKANTMPSVKI